MSLRHYIFAAVSIPCAMFAMEPDGMVEKPKLTEYDLAIHFLKNTPPKDIPDLILKKFPEHVRREVFEKLVFGVDGFTYQEAKDCLLLTGQYLELEARDHERQFVPSTSLVTPLAKPTVFPWVMRLDKNEWVPRKQTPVEKHEDGFGARETVPDPMHVKVQVFDCMQHEDYANGIPLLKQIIYTVPKGPL
jgi:hypothetical protein